MKFFRSATRLFASLFVVAALLSASVINVCAQENSVSTVLSGVQSSQGYNHQLITNTKYGKVQGVNEAQTFIWFDIPYAKAPVGQLRWKAPQDPEPWEGVLDATKSKNDTIQIAGTGTKGSEDSLSLNIYRPPTNEKNLPVLMFVHGGNNQTGSKLDLSPNKLATNANCIVVTIGYRLDLLGFNNLPALKTGNALEDSGNYSVLDFAKSLDWINENVTAFGGDPNNITVSGFSAGGRDVMAMLISPIMKGKFHKAISFSGGMTVADPVESAKVIAKAMAKVVVEDQIKKTEAEAYTWLLQDSNEVREYLYALPAERLVRIMGNALIRMSVFPHLYADGVVLPKDGFATKDYIQVPLIMLTGSNEFASFTTRDPYFSAAQKQGKLLSDVRVYNEMRFTIKYGSKLYELFNAEESAVKMIDNYKAPIYTCDIVWGSDKTIVGNEMAELVGATHGIFLPFLTDENIGPRKTYPESFNNDGAKDLTAKFQKYIANFLRTGNPNGEGLVKWEAWTNAHKGPSQLMLSADKDKAIINMSYDRVSYADIIKAIEADQSISVESKQKIIKKVFNGRWFSNQLDQHFANPSLWVK